MRSRLLQVPIEIRPDIGTALATGGAGELVLQIGQPRCVRPRVGIDPDRVAASFRDF